MFCIFVTNKKYIIMPLDYDLDNYQDDYDNDKECYICGSLHSKNGNYCSYECFKNSDL